VLAACGTGDSEQGLRGSQSRGSAQVGGQVVSTVHGHPITVSDVQDLVRAGLSPEQALRRLQGERLLMAEAEQRGLGKQPAVEQVARQASVQSLLQSVTDAANASDEQLRAAYDRAKSRFEQPERRVTVHVLAKLPKNATAEADAAARAFAAQMIDRLAQVSDYKAFAASLKRETSSGFKIVFERLPAMHRQSNLVQSFLDAMFELQEPGVVRRPVRTTFGWHAIRVLEIRPSTSTSYEEAAEQLRAELVLERKKQLVDELLAAARKENRFELGADLRQTLAKLEL
jgi:parvulin-like peptidyl-prolyl isomerase